MDAERPTPARIGYGRVSKHQQDTDLQRQALIRGGCWRIITEEVSSGKKVRPGLRDAIALCEPGDTLVVWKLDRLARSMIETLTLVELFQARGIKFVSLTEGFDTDTPMGQMMLGVLASFAQYERAMIRERTTAGLAAARARGWFGGAPRKLVGPKLAKAKRLLADGLTQTEVAGAVGVSRSTLVRWARDSGYPSGPVERADFLRRHPDPANFVTASEDPAYGRNPARRAS